MALSGSVQMDAVVLMPAHALGQAVGLATTFFTVHLHHPSLSAMPLVSKEALAFSLVFGQTIACLGQSDCHSLPSSLVFEDASRVFFLYYGPFQNLTIIWVFYNR